MYFVWMQKGWLWVVLSCCHHIGSSTCQMGCCTTVAVAAQIWELADNESDLSLILGVHEPIPALFVCPVTNWFSICTYVCRMDLGVCFVCHRHVQRKCLTRFETYTLSSRWITSSETSLGRFRCITKYDHFETKQHKKTPIKTLNQTFKYRHTGSLMDRTVRQNSPTGS